jgi:hypothetical protein
MIEPSAEKKNADRIGASFLSLFFFCFFGFRFNNEFAFVVTAFLADGVRQREFAAVRANDH